MEALNWLPVVAAGASVVAVIRFWIDLGKVWRQAEDAAMTASALAAKTQRCGNTSTPWRDNGPDEDQTFSSCRLPHRSQWRRCLHSL
jgi:hypothetical protein